MGFLSALGKIAPFAAMAIPGVGPALGMGIKAIGATSGALGALGQIAGGAAKGAGQSRESANTQAMMADRNKLDAYQAQQQAVMQALLGQSNEQLRSADIDLLRKKFAVEAPQMRGKQALLGSLMQNMQPVQMSGLSPQIASRMPQISGGLSPAALGPLARQMGGLLQSNAVSGQQAGDQFDPLQRTNFGGGLLPAPGLSSPQKAGMLEKILGGVGFGGSLLGGLGELFGGGKRNDFMAFDRTLTPPPGARG